MGRSGYDTTNFRDSGSDPNAPPPRRAGMGLIVPTSSSSQHDPKGKGKERADAPSGAQTSHTHLPPVRRSADFREAVVEPFPVLPQSQRQPRGFGLQVGPRGYGAGGGNRARALEIHTTGGRNNPIDVEMGGTSSSAGLAGTGGGISDDDLKTPRASQFALPDNFPGLRAASRSSQHPQTYQPYLAHNQVHNQYDGLPPPPPRRILPSQAAQFGFTTNKSSSDGNGNFHTQSQGSRSQPFNSNTPPSVSSRRNVFTSDTAEPPQFARGDTMAAHQYQEPLGNARSSDTGIGAYDFGSSSSSFGTSDARDFYLRTVTPHPGPTPMGLSFSPEEWGRPSESMTASAAATTTRTTAASTPRSAAAGPPPGFPPGFNTGPGGSGPRLEDRGFPFFPQPVTQAERDRRRKAALDAGFEELLAKRQKRNH